MKVILEGARHYFAELCHLYGLVLVAIGLVVGLTTSFWATNLIQRLLYGIQAGDPITFVSIAVGFGLVAALACLVPAWRATRVNPVVTLKAE